MFQFFTALKISSRFSKRKKKKKESYSLLAVLLWGARERVKFSGDCREPKFIYKLGFGRRGEEYFIPGYPPRHLDSERTQIRELLSSSALS